MSFQRSAESLRSRLQIGALKPPLVVGVLIGAIAVIVVAYLLLPASSGFSIERVDATETSTAALTDIKTADHSSDSDGSTLSIQDTIFIHVCGAVVTPGLYQIQAGSRIDDAVRAAGGFTEDAAIDALNLARQVNDGEQVIVPTISQIQQIEVDTSETVSSIPGVTVTGKININQANVSELDSLPGIGEATAEKIIDYRQTNGPFLSPEDIKRVSGIGDKKYQQLAELICVG